MPATERKLRSLSGVGPAIEADFHLLGIHTVEALAAADPDSLYEALCEKTGTRQDPCVLDTFRCAVAQARDPHLPIDQRSWWWWSRQRKQMCLAGASTPDSSEGFAAVRAPLRRQ